MAKFKKPATFIKEEALYYETYDFVKKLMEDYPTGISAYFDEKKEFFRIDVTKCSQELRLKMLAEGFEEI